MTPDVFRALRRHLGMTQKAVARGVGVSSASICIYERTGKGLAEWRAIQAGEKMLATWKIWGTQ